MGRMSSDASVRMTEHDDESNLLTDEQRAETLFAFGRALGREAHVLPGDPDLLWQQVYNRLQWEDQPIPALLGPEFERRTRPGARPWLRTRTPFPESEAIIRTLAGHADRVSHCAFSPDGSWIVSASQDGTLKIWDQATGAERATLQGHGAGVNRCCVSPDGALIVSASRDETLIVWDAAKGTPRATLRGHAGPVTDCQISPDGRYVASAGWDRCVRLWDPRNGEQIRALQAGESGHGPYSCAISPNGSLVAAALRGSLRIWDALSGKQKWQFDSRVAGPGGPFAFSPDGSLIACANADATVSLWDLCSGRECAHLTRHCEEEIPEPGIGEREYIVQPGVTACTFAPDGSWLVTGSNMGLVRRWNVPTGSDSVRLARHARGVNACTVSPDGRYVVSASEDHTVRVSDPVSGTKLGSLEGHSGEVVQCITSPDGTDILSASDDHTLRIWRVRSEAPFSPVSKHGNIVSACSISPDGSFAATASWDGTIAISDTSSGRRRAVCRGHRGSVEDCAVTPDGRSVISWSDDLTLRLWHPKTGSEQATLSASDLSSVPGHSFGPGTARACAVAPDGSYAIAVSQYALHVWNLRSGTERVELRFIRDKSVGQACAIAPDASFFVAGNDSDVVIYDATNGVQGRVFDGRAPLALSPDSRLILYCGHDTRTLVISSVHSGHEQARLIGHSAKVRACVFSHDGSSAASGAEDGSVMIWDISRGVARAETPGHNGAVRDCVFAPGDAIVITIGSDRMVRLWDSDTGVSLGAFPLLAEGASLDINKSKCLVVVGDAGGTVYVVDLIPRDARPPESSGQPWPHLDTG